eukprot:NODE_355_length_10246_cov_0.288263.p2 type:complete len:688 gc:universal NODE_355_length_10246_cov_0.288263:4312-6375(+)
MSLYSPSIMSTPEDPFQYLESNSDKTNRFITDQNNKLSSFLKVNPQIQKDLTSNFNYERFSIYRYHHPYYYFTYNPGLLNQSLLMRIHVDSKVEQVVLDPNLWSTDGTVCLTIYSISKNGNYLCYCKSTSGSDWTTIHALDLNTFTPFPEHLEYCKFTSITFTHDELGTFYQQYPKPNTSDLGTDTDVSINPTLKYHIWGSDPTSDRVIYKDPSNPKYMYYTRISHSGNLLFITVSRDCESKNLLFYIPLTDFKLPSEFKIVRLIDYWDAEYSYVHDMDNILILKTNLKAPNHKLIKYDLNDNSCTDLLTKYHLTGYAVMQDAFVSNNYLCIEWLVDVEGKLTIHKMDSTLVKEIQFDQKCVSFAGIYARYDSTVMIVKIYGFSTPGLMYSVNMQNEHVGDYSLLRATEIKMDMSSIKTTKEWVTASDGTKIPMFVTRDISRISRNDPIYLYGYGGFNITLDPYFSMTAAAFIKYCNGIYAVACIRGGGELGEDWHLQGIKMNKKRGLKDFIECAEYLKAHYSNKLFIHGGSNGGLLTAACSQLSPSSFDAAICDVGVLDMLKYHKYTIGLHNINIGHAWISDYGDPDDSEMRAYLKSYSPYHNPNKDIPWLLCCTSSHDDRVSPHHSYKFVANQQCSDKIFLRVELKSGHGQGRSVEKTIKEWTDKFSFLCQVLNIGWHSDKSPIN